MGIKVIKWMGVALVVTTVFGSRVQAQSAEAEQLLLNVEKLSQLKNILSDMKKGYQVISHGYSAVKNIAQGNFSIHETFMDGLMMVSPEVRKYPRIAEIISLQSKLVGEYKAALKRFRASDLLNAGELDYLADVYALLFSQSMDNLDELSMILTASMLRMSDEERLKSIDRIFEDTQDKLSFLRSFNREASLLLLQRRQTSQDLKGVKALFKNK